MAGRSTCWYQPPLPFCRRGQTQLELGGSRRQGAGQIQRMSRFLVRTFESLYFNYISTLPVGRQPEWLSLTHCSIPGTPNHCLLGPRNRTVKTAGFQGGQPWASILSLSLPDVYEPVHASEPLVPHAQTRLLMGEQAGRGGYWAPIRGNRAPAMSPPSLNEESLSLRPPPCVFTSKQVRIVHD